MSILICDAPRGEYFDDKGLRSYSLTVVRSLSLFSSFAVSYALVLYMCILARVAGYLSNSGFASFESELKYNIHSLLRDRCFTGILS